MNKLLFLLLISFLKFFGVFAEQNESSSMKIVIEGMPGAGKTSAIFHLANELEGRCIIIPEVNPEPTDVWKTASIKDQGTVFHQIWVSRMEILRSFSGKNHCFLLDRNYISNLAFTYAMDKFKGTNLYPIHKQAILNDMNLSSDISLLIILDVSPELSIKRRSSLKQSLPWPWMEIDFLEGFREFYIKELPLLFQKEITHIATDSLTQEEVRSQIMERISPLLPAIKPKEKLNISQKDIDKLMQFAALHNLGSFRSLPILVFNYPTIYFSKHGVQLDEHGNPVFFNNKRLSDLSLQ